MVIPDLQPGVRNTIAEEQMTFFQRIDDEFIGAINSAEQAMLSLICNQLSFVGKQKRPVPGPGQPPQPPRVTLTGLMSPYRLPSLMTATARTFEVLRILIFSWSPALPFSGIRVTLAT